MRIRKVDVGYKKPIIQITPNSYAILNKWIDENTLELAGDFRGHGKYAKRLYHAFKPLWWAIHYWDTLIANQLVPQLNLGFDTLTVYPDAGTGLTTVDGTAGRNGVSEDWATIIAGAGTTSNATGNPQNLFLAQVTATSDRFSAFNRFIMTFYTSALTSAATISAAVLSIFGVDKNDGLVAAPNVDIYTSTPAANNALANADYSQIGSVSQTGSPITYASWSTTGYNDFTFDATGIGNISKTSISKFGARNANYDVAAVTMPWVINEFCRLQASTSDNTGTSQDPKLVITS